jgi:hypothetical protein
VGTVFPKELCSLVIKPTIDIPLVQGLRASEVLFLESGRALAGAPARQS